MDQAEKYNEYKKRNEQQLLTIRKLETHISKARIQVCDRRKVKLQLEETNEHLKRLTLQQANFQKQILDATNISQHNTLSSSSRKRDLVKLLVVTPEKICEKLEQLINIQVSTEKTISSNDLLQLKQLINRLPDPQNKEQFNNIIQHLHDELRKRSSYVYSNTKYSIDKRKIDTINKFLEHRKRKVKELSKRNEQLALECQEAENLLKKRVEELHENPSVQQALIKSIRLKAASHQAQTELNSMKNQVEELANQISTIEDQTKQQKNSSQAMGILNKLAIIQERTQLLLNTTNKRREALESQSQKLKEEQAKDNVSLLKRIEAVKSKLSNDTLLAMQQIHQIESKSKDLVDAKNKMSPYSLISTMHFVKEILSTIQSINSLENESVVELCLEIRETLEKLVEKWSSSLSKQEVYVPSDVPEYHDGIDNVIQSIDAIRLHFQEKEHAYIQTQEQKLKSKLAASDSIEREIRRTQDALEERDLLTTIGDSFAVADKSFREWSEALLK